ncbi:SCAN domain-containing protein 3 [Trichonephila clavipes]|nr:SCAN domain-containing protein 3 [Trichonephila clavipes]
MSSASKKKSRHYSEEYLKFGFIPAVQDERIPFCLLCQQFLRNESMKRGRLEAHLKAKHGAHINTDLCYFKTLKENFEKRTTAKSLFTAYTSTNNRVLEASYQISLFIAKTEKSYTIGEYLIKPSILAFLKTVLEKDDKDVEAMPLSKNTVSRRIDEMGEAIGKQLVEKLKTRKISVQVEESTLRDSVAVLITYINITSCAADGAPNMMGKKIGCLKLMKDAHPEIILVHCVIHMQNLVAKNISPVLNEVLNNVIKCVNVIKFSAKCERLFKLFCEEQNKDHLRLLLHTEVRCLSKENCLNRFMELFDTLSDFLNDKPEMKHLLTIDGKSFVNYLADMFEKLNTLNKQLQGTNKTLVDAKTKIFYFITNIVLCQKH